MVLNFPLNNARARFRARVFSHIYVGHSDGRSDYMWNRLYRISSLPVKVVRFLLYFAYKYPNGLKLLDH